MAIDLKKIPVVNSLEETFQKMIECGYKFPDFSEAETINCVSDYAGDRKSDNHYVYSFVFFDYIKSGEFCHLINELRKNESEWKDHSFIEYKKLTKDKVRKRLLPKFLNAADSLKGILVVFYVDKNVKSLFAQSPEEVSNTLKTEGFGEWKPLIAEKLLEIILIQSFFASKFVNSRQKYFWYSDRDAINDEGKDRFVYVGKLLGHFLESFGTYPKFSGYGTNYEKDNYFGDVMGIADLCSGATLEYFEEQLGKNSVKESSNEIIKWFAVDSTTFKKLKLRIKLNSDGSQSISTVDYRLKNE